MDYTPCEFTDAKCNAVGKYYYTIDGTLQYFCGEHAHFCEAITRNGHECSKRATFGVTIDNVRRYVCHVHNRTDVVLVQLKKNVGDCCICMNDCLEDESVVLSCSHLYHKQCLVQWFLQEKDTCPYCRCVISIDDFRKADDVFDYRQELRQLQNTPLTISTQNHVFVIDSCFLDYHTIHDIKCGIAKYIHDVYRLAEVIERRSRIKGKLFYNVLNKPNRDDYNRDIPRENNMENNRDQDDEYQRQIFDIADTPSIPNDWFQ